MKVRIRFMGGRLDGRVVESDSPEFRQPPFDGLPDFGGLASLGDAHVVDGERYIVSKVNASDVNTNNPSGEIVLERR